MGQARVLIGRQSFEQLLFGTRHAGDLVTGGFILPGGTYLPAFISFCVLQTMQICLGVSAGYSSASFKYAYGIPGAELAHITEFMTVSLVLFAVYLSTASLMIVRKIRRTRELRLRSWQHGIVLMLLGADDRLDEVLKSNSWMVRILTPHLKSDSLYGRTRLSGQFLPQLLGKDYGSSATIQITAGIICVFSHLFISIGQLDMGHSATMSGSSLLLQLLATYVPALGLLLVVDVGMEQMMGLSILRDHVRELDRWDERTATEEAASEE
ncbi:MAG: hypothetical protein R3F46_03050 [bacterium]